jgi:hypothetical protein
MFVIYDEYGCITHTAAGPHPDTYGKVLDEQGARWLFVTDQPVDIVRHCVDTQSKKIVEKPTMNLAVSGGVVSGIPVGCSVTIFFGGSVVAQEVVSDGQIDLEAVTGGVYTIVLDCKPYESRRLEVEL